MQKIKLMSTGIPNLDTVLGGGIPVYSLNIIAGAPGSGKTILVQQMMFNYIHTHKAAKTLYLSTLSEPSLKVVRYMQRFDFFDAEAFGERMIYADIGEFVAENPLSSVSNRIMELVDQYHPDLVVIDSFRAIRDLSNNSAEFRCLCYNLAVLLASARCTTFLVSECGREQIENGAEFAIADGILYLDISLNQGEVNRSAQVCKLRGQSPLMNAFPFTISSEGMRILSPTLSLRQAQVNRETETKLMTTGIPGLDVLLRGGIFSGRSLILSGASGTGKTTLALQFLVQGAQIGEKGLLISFEESTERLHQAAAGFGWQLQELEDRGLLQIIFIPQIQIRVEEQLEQIIAATATFKPRRLVIDSLSVFLYKVQEPAIQREKLVQLATLVQCFGAVGLFISDIPAIAPESLSHFGVEETVVDGTIVLSTERINHQLGGQGFRRYRYLEVYKMRGTDHVTGRHRMEITPQGIEVLSAALVSEREAREQEELGEVSIYSEPPPLVFAALKGLIQGDLRYGSAWLVQGEPGVGKSTLAYQFAIEGLLRKESVLYITADAPKEKVYQSLQNLGFLPDPYLESGQLLILDAFSPGNDNLDLSDPETLMFTIARQLNRLSRPCRKIFDSLAPLAAMCTPREFISLIYRKNRLLRQPDVAMFNTFPQLAMADSDRYSLLNAYDVVLNLYTPDWGEMNQQGKIGNRALKIGKIRGARADLRPYPYTISLNEGILLQPKYYQWGTHGS
ncbi:MAG: AAA family ATPase [Symploca sp. SIO2C1]|nr:AAA family ATPase [Symploca sp. SIO2C1]